MRRLVAGALTTLLLLAGAGGAPAYAEGEIGLSEDGGTWSARLPGPLFESAGRWVPGDVRTRAFHVRNQSADAAVLRIEVRAAHADRSRLGGDLALTAQVGEDPWVVPPRSEGAFVLPDQQLGPGDRVRVRVRVAFAPTATNQAQAAEFALRIRVVLTDARASGGPAADTTEPATGGGPLPGTGAPMFGWLLLLAASLVGAGAAVLHGRREVAGRG